MNWMKTILIAMTLALSFNANAMTDDDEAIFKEAITSGDMKVTKRFVDADANVVNEKFFGWAPLQMASNRNQIEMVKYLLSKGAEINYVHPTAKNTAFQLAALNGFVELTKYLAAQGAEVNHKLHGGVSLIRYYNDLGVTEMVDLLTKLGVKDDGCQGEQCFAQH